MHSSGQSRQRRGVGLLVTLLVLAALASGLVVGVRAIPAAQRPTLARSVVPEPLPTEPGDSPGAAPTTRPPGAPPAEQITLAFAGDVHFEGRVENRLANPRTTFGPVAAVLSKADLAMVNLETSITDRGSPEPKQFYFRAPATAFAAMRSAGVDITTMANNHGVDFGAIGLQDSLAAAASTRFPTVGIGADARRAYAPWYGDVRGHRVAILGASQIRDHTLSAWTAGPNSPGIASAYSERLVTAVKTARQNAEIVVVYVHWGVEGQACPTADQRNLARRLAEAGADAVVGTHAHLLLGGGWLGPTYVGYGLGNFLWWRDNAYSNDTGVLTLTFRGRRAVASTFTPARIDSTGAPIPATGAEAQRILATWNQVRGCAGLAPSPAG